MKKLTVAQIYAYAVCFTCFFVASTALCIGLYHAIGIVKPELIVSGWELKQVNTFEHYKHYQLEHWESEMKYAVKKPVRPTDDELEKKWPIERESIFQETKREGFQWVIRMGISLLITLPIFFIHWRLGKRLSAEAGQLE